MIINLDTIPKQKFLNSKESPPYIMEESYQVIVKRFKSELADERICEVLSIYEMLGCKASQK